MIYLKTYFYVDHEIQFLISNLCESYDYVDKFIICEFNKTHTGRERELIGWDTLSKHLPKDKIDKVLYIPVDISEYVSDSYDNEEIIHSVNEPVMRSIFMKYVHLNDEDIVVSVDADEIIYRDSYPKLIEAMKTEQICSLRLHQFFYKKTYLWKNNDFIAPTVARYSYFKDRFPCNLRNEGPTLPFKAGCHFSWCMSVDEMIYKLHTYGHPRYRFCADKSILEKSIQEKTYPFDKTVNFVIEEIDTDSIVLPSSMRTSVSKINL